MGGWRYEPGGGEGVYPLNICRSFGSNNVAPAMTPIAPMILRSNGEFCTKEVPITMESRQVPATKEFQYSLGMMDDSPLLSFLFIEWRQG
jgi:hypothetical protein